MTNAQRYSQLEDYEELTSTYGSLHDNYVSNKWSSKWPISALLATGCLIVVGVLLAIVVIERLKNEDGINSALNTFTTVTCCYETAPDGHSSIVLVESIPRCVDFGSNVTFGKNLYEAWTDLLSLATKQIDVASLYWTLTGEDLNVNSSTDRLGRDILERFKALPSRNISVRVVTSIPTLAPNSTDLKTLKENGIQVRRLNFGHLTEGILHTTFWIVDGKHIYIGSANMDWRTLTQVKELGVVIYNSSSLATDLHKIFQSYWVTGRNNASIPDPWPSSYDTGINEERPLLVNLSGAPSKVYITASPSAFCPDSRTRDLDAILSIIRDAQRFIHVAVMEFYPASKFFHRHGYWPVIEKALKQSAVERNVSVCLLVGCGRDIDPSVWPFLESPDALRSPTDNINIEVKVYIIPMANQSHIPNPRVNHNKYMLTDKVAYIGTSDWSADFNTTAGVGLVVSQDVLHSVLPGNAFHGQLSAVFDRDWNSQYAIPLDKLNQNHDCLFPKSTP
ncbi:5'-3' exonuclease PLD4 isoform X2 [Xyrauchen texanus]|uniref:5'-3' exonuclease PLD4 isoform X2 n=1 Tax=Xyrauchen texanus TaxID=154827 RepID=UPI002241AF2C|nr:5'-3' exonuclease PLD4 isoform X2 [Xyrauchen texanus]